MVTASYVPQTLDIEAYRGDDLAIPVTFASSTGPVVPINVSTWTLAAQVRTHPNAADPPLASFTVDMTGAATGEVVFNLAASVMATLPSFQLTWDVQRTLSAKKRTLVAGSFHAAGDRTRP